MEDLTDILTPLITAQAIIIAALAVWKQYWISLYRIYDEDNRNPKLDCNNQIWFASLVASLLSWAIFTGIISLIIFVGLILSGVESLNVWQTGIFSLGLGLALYTMAITLMTVLSSAWPTWHKAMKNERWGTYQFDVDGSSDNKWKTRILKAVFIAFFGDREYHKLFTVNHKDRSNRHIRYAVKHVGIILRTALLLFTVLPIAIKLKAAYPDISYYWCVVGVVLFIIVLLSISLLIRNQMEKRQAYK